jgi:hypothetical protein
MPQGLWGGEAAWDAIFDRIEGPPTPEAELDFEFGTGPSDASLMSSQAVLSALTQLLTVLMQKGIISREEVAERFRDFLPTKVASR